MRIAFVEIKDANDRRGWSGTVYHMCKALEAAGAQVELISPLDLRPALGWRMLARAARATTGKQLLWERVPSVGRALGRQVDRRLAKSGADWIVSPSSLLMPWIRDPRPKAFWTDATFDGMIDFYLKRSDSLEWSRRQGSAGEQASLRATRLAVYSSEWAAQTARDHYQTQPGRVVTIPYGPNMELIPTAPEIRAHVAQKILRPVSLLFVGADWQRKRAAFAIEVAVALSEMGVPTTLELVGCQPPEGFTVPSLVRLHGFISKNSEEGRRKLRDLYRAAHFFVLPSEAEACAMVLAEAISYGVPLVGTAVGGMSTIVREGISGRLFPINVGARSYATYIAETMADRERYLSLANSARSLYDDELNWSIAGRRFLAALENAKATAVA